MGETANKKPVNTLLDKALWKEAVLANVRWVKALELGVTLLLDGGNKKLEELREERNKTQAHLNYLNNEIAKLEAEQENQEEQDEKVKRHLALLKESAEVLAKDISFLRGRTRLWTNKTGMNLTPDEFYKLVKRFERGDFNPPIEVKS